MCYPIPGHSISIAKSIKNSFTNDSLVEILPCITNFPFVVNKPVITHKSLFLLRLCFFGGEVSVLDTTVSVKSVRNENTVKNGLKVVLSASVVLGVARSGLKLPEQAHFSFGKACSTV